MSKAIKRRRGSTLQHSTFTGLAGELTVDTDINTLIVHDGSTVGGHPMAKDSEVVHNTGNETISGTKTFSSTISGSITGNANTAVYLKNAVTIANVAFNGNTSISIPFDNLTEKPDSILDYGITDAYTKTETDSLLNGKANNNTTLSGYGITDAYTKSSTNTAISTAIANLVNSAPSTLDTLNELAIALGNDANFSTTVATNIGVVNSNVNSHITNTLNPHATTASQVGLGNVENKSSATIRSEITSSNVTTALGFTPQTTLVSGTNIKTVGGSSLLGSGNVNTIPVGGIILWYGSIVSIPSGWALCDGNNGTPNLKDKFVVGAGSTYSVGGTGGSTDAVIVSHTHSVSDPGHNHTVPLVPYYGTLGSEVDGAKNTGGTTGTSTSTTGISISSTGESGTNKNLPPYYALAYIMRIS